MLTATFTSDVGPAVGLPATIGIEDGYAVGVPPAPLHVYVYELPAESVVQGAE